MLFLTAIFLFLIGACVGSFTSVFIYRLHAGKRSIFGGRSECPDCDKKLAPLDLIPILSFLTLRGKCRYCNKDISYMYPALELVTGWLFVLLFFKFPFLNENLQFSGRLVGLYLLHAYFLFTLIFTFFFDLRYLKVADEILLPAILIGLIATLGYPNTLHLTDALLGAAIPFVFFGFQYLLSRGTWVGLGDLRVGAFMGVILGWKLIILGLFLAYLLGSIAAIFITAKKKQFYGVKIPFAPFLTAGAVISMFWGEIIVDWYLAGMAW